MFVSYWLMAASHTTSGPGDVSILYRKTAGCHDNIQLSLCLIKHLYNKNVDNAFLTLALDDAECLASAPAHLPL